MAACAAADLQSQLDGAVIWHACMASASVGAMSDRIELLKNQISIRAVLHPTLSLLQVERSTAARSAWQSKWVMLHLRLLGRYWQGWQHFVWQSMLLRRLQESCTRQSQQLAAKVAVAAWQHQSASRKRSQHVQASVHYLVSQKHVHSKHACMRAWQLSIGVSCSQLLQQNVKAHTMHCADVAPLCSCRCHTHDAGLLFNTSDCTHHAFSLLPQKHTKYCIQEPGVCSYRRPWRTGGAGRSGMRAMQGCLSTGCGRSTKHRCLRAGVPGGSV